ncbi:hypothetical protein PT974_11379 [Cladobotryum mycophilum]|uniref:C2H2-type domain-containing protein n=1 Tax=Cladobotryum mycophilum TaxID=491253 RepID=A0ABR0S651_9HYPO
MAICEFIPTTERAALGTPEEHQMSLSTDVSLVIDLSINQDQRVEQLLPEHPSDSLHINNGLMPEMGICPQNLYNDGRESSVSYQSSPGYSFCPSPSIMGEDYVIQGPATPQDVYGPPAGHEGLYNIPYKSEQTSYTDMTEMSFCYGTTEERRCDVHMGHLTFLQDPVNTTFGTPYNVDYPGGLSRASSTEEQRVFINRFSPGQGESQFRTGSRSGRPQRRAAASSGGRTPQARHSGCVLKRRQSPKPNRPYKCVFDFAGCLTTFDTKNEWKRHVLTQHVCLNYWICEEGSCATTRGSGTQHRSHLLPALGSIFNRKDLYTQHVRRMHPQAIGHVLDSDGRLPSPEAADQLRQMQTAAFRQRVQLPYLTDCPADECKQKYRGASAWNSRMEHISLHLEPTSNQHISSFEFGGPKDQLLVDWASREDVGIIKRRRDGWQICDLLRGESSPRRFIVATTDEDAEGEFI